MAVSASANFPYHVQINVPLTIPSKVTSVFFLFGSTCAVWIKVVVLVNAGCMANAEENCSCVPLPSCDYPLQTMQ